MRKFSDTFRCSIHQKGIGEILNGLTLAYVHSQFMKQQHDDDNITTTNFDRTLPVLCQDNCKTSNNYENISSCLTCAILLRSREEQRQHYQSDWHVANLKRKVHSLPQISHDDFRNLQDHLKNMSCPNQELSPSKEFADIFNSCQGHFLQLKEESFEAESGQPSPKNCSKLFFKNANNKIISIYRCILCHKKKSLGQDDLVRSVWSLTNDTNWAVFLSGGGHWAGAIFFNDKIICSKTFHRYTVRAKMGKSQKSKDSQGSMAHSAGAGIRRYNEKSLQRDISSTIHQWGADLTKCDIIFVSTYKAEWLHQQWQKPNSVFKKNDGRLRKIPFQTFRPTLTELKRVHSLMSSVEVYSEKHFNLQSEEPVKVSQQNVCQGNHDNRSSTNDIKELERSCINQPHTTCILSQSNDHLESLKNKISVNDLKDLEISPKKVSKSKRKPATRQHLHQPAALNIDENEDKSSLHISSLERENLRNLLYSACKVGNLAELQRLLSSNIKAVSSSRSSTMNGHESQSSDRTIGDQSTECGNKPFVDCNVQLILNDCLGKNKQSLLHVAVSYGHCHLIRELLKSGCDPSLCDISGVPPYCYANDDDIKKEFESFRQQNPDLYDYNKAKIFDSASKTGKQRKKKTRHRKGKNNINSLDPTNQEAHTAGNKCDCSDISNKSGQSVLRCCGCSCDISHLEPFEYFNFKFCSTSCLKKHRQQRI